MKTSAPAKIILLGEHAVVYGQPAIAVPISRLRAEAIVTDADKPLHILAGDTHNQRLIELNTHDPLAQAALLALRALNMPVPNAAIILRSTIPIASGLGSGAATATALIRAICDYAGRYLPDDKINELVYEIEKIHHGTPSGIDNTVVVYEQAVVFVRGQPVQTITNAKPFTLLIADTGKAALTRSAVADVRKLYDCKPAEIQPVIENIGHIVRQALVAMQIGDSSLLGRLMTENHALLQQLTVSSDELDRLVGAAMDAGALGAKLSGGGRGGNMIALVPDDNNEQVQHALFAAGAVSVFQTTIERT